MSWLKRLDKERFLLVECPHLMRSVELQALNSVNTLPKILNPLVFCVFNQPLDIYITILYYKHEKNICFYFPTS